MNDRVNGATMLPTNTWQGSYSSVARKRLICKQAQQLCMSEGVASFKGWWVRNRMGGRVGEERRGRELVCAWRGRLLRDTGGWLWTVYYFPIKGAEFMHRSSRFWTTVREIHRQRNENRALTENTADPPALIRAVIRAAILICGD